MHPILLKVGPVTLYSYGLMVALGFLAALWSALRRAKALGLDRSRIQGLALWVLLAGIVGGRLGYVILFWDSFRDNLWEIFRLDHGGLVFYGGLIGGLLAGFLYIGKARLPFFSTVDLAIPPLVLGHAIGRVGCLLNGCCFGKPTSVPWAVSFPFDGIPRHPTQLYESLGLMVLFLLLKQREKRNPKPGEILFTYGLLYAGARFFIEFLRADNPILAGGWTIFQWISLPLAILSGLALLRRKALPHP